MDANSIVDFKDFLKVWTTILRLTVRFFNENNVQAKAERRALLEAGKEREYQMKVQQQMTRQTIIRNTISMEVIAAFGITP